MKVIVAYSDKQGIGASLVQACTAAATNVQGLAVHKGEEAALIDTSSVEVGENESAALLFRVLEEMRITPTELVVGGSMARAGEEEIGSSFVAALCLIARVKGVPVNLVPRVESVAKKTVSESDLREAVSSFTKRLGESANALFDMQKIDFAATAKKLRLSRPDESETLYV
uniref:Uncharacterized protein n=1 Tax=Palpitomonas bilix TaxID=652834 RepID=A0A7S3D1G4_9EUKA